MRHADRHGRAQRADGDRRRRPVDGFRVRDEDRFRRLVEDAVADLPPRYLEQFRDARLVIADVPAVEDIPMTSAQEGADAASGTGRDWEPTLAAFVVGTPSVLTAYRRPLELRAGSRLDLNDVIQEAVARAVSTALGWDEEGWRDGG